MRSRSALGERVADLLEAGDRLLDLLRESVAIGEVDIGPDRARGSRDAGRVAEARTGRWKPLIAGRKGFGRLRHEHIGKHVRKVRDGREDPVVCIRIDRGRPSTEAAEQPVKPLVEQSRRAGARGQVPRRSLEQVGAGVARRPNSRRRRADGRRRSEGRRARLRRPAWWSRHRLPRSRAGQRRARH